MKYTVKQLSILANISKRTIRYYDEIDLLKPAELSSNGYRIYSTKEVDLLQQILFFRELDLPLEEIKQIIYEKDFDEITTLSSHLINLEKQKKRLEQLILTVEKTLQYKKGMYNMKDTEKFAGLKQDLLNKNEAEFGKELGEKFTPEQRKKANKQFANLTEDDFNKMNALNDELFEKLTQLLKTNDISSSLGLEIATLHKQWLTFTWNQYSIEAHHNLAEMYIADERFTAYYDNAAGIGAAKLLRDCIIEHIK